MRTVVTAMRRRWYLVVLVMATALAGFFLLSSDGGTYTTTTIVSFAVPATTSLSFDNGSTDSSVIAFARSVAAQVNIGRDPVSYSEDSAPYYGAGLRQGVLIDVPSDGNQFFDSYKHAEIDIQIVGRSEAWVQQQQEHFVNEVLTVTQAQQKTLVGDAVAQLSASVLPLTQDIVEITPTRTARAEALAALLLAGLLVGAWAAVVVDRRFARQHDIPAVETVPRRPLTPKASLA